mgnify:CR=1 FL=1
MDKKYSDVFHARWLSNELTEEEKSDFEASEDFEIYKKIAEKSTEFMAPNFDKSQVFENIQNQIHQRKQKKSISLFKPLMYAAAASIALFFGLFYFLNLPEKHVSGIGEQLAITLPDNSEVLLNSNSTLSYSKKNWNKNRTLELKGEAYFKVEKGSDFTVETKEGKVTVLGTQFNVKTEKGLFEVICFEGKVKAETIETESILTKGNAFRKMKDSLPEKWNVTAKEPTWKKGETTFKSMPLKYVIIALENQYKIHINATNIDVKKKFTGSFTHKNLQIALQTVFVPMKIGVTFKDKENILLHKQ